MSKVLKLLLLFDLKDFLTLVSLLIFFATALISDFGIIFLLISLLGLAVSISSSVYYAEVIAKRIGPSLGTLVLALSVTIIEVALILNLMQSDPGKAASVARDAVFAAVMIVTNGIVGISILLGGLRRKELGFQSLGTSSLMGILVTLTTITMVLPNYTTSSVGPTYSSTQLVFVSIFALFIYAALIWAQTKSHKSFFEHMTEAQFKVLESELYVPSELKTWISLGGLFTALVVVVGMAKVLSPTLSKLVVTVGAPSSSVGIIVALLVLAPETFAAVNAARANQLQTSLNLALGSGAASIALTIPVVSLYSIYSEQSLILGLDQKSLAFLILTFIAGGFTFGAGRTTALHGIIHLVILLSYLVLSFVP